MRIVLSLIAMLAVGCDDSSSTTAFDLAVAVDQGPVDLNGIVNVARGQYLVNSLLFCGDCHTTPDATTGLPSTDPSAFLAGGRSFSLPGGDGGLVKVYAKNLTPDPATGLGNWTIPQIKTAITQGLDDNGAPLYSIMPYQIFANLTDADVTSIALYLQSVPAQMNTVPNDTAPAGKPPAALDGTMVPHSVLPTTDLHYASAERGRYLATVGCLSCHTVVKSGLPDLTKAFGGGRTFKEGSTTTISANLTTDKTGLYGWSTNDIVQTLKTDQERGTGRQLCPPMPGGASRLGSLVDGDLEDLANYVFALPPVSFGPFGCSDGGVPFAPDGFLPPTDMH